MAARVTQGQRRAFELRKAADADRILGNFRPRPIAEEQSAHVLLTDLDDDRAFEVRREADTLLATASDRLGGRRVDPLLELIDRPRREHLWTDQVVPVPIDRSTLPRDLRRPDIIEIEVEGVADHLVGSVRAVQKEDLERRPFGDGTDLGGYRAGTGQIGSQMVGSRGLEAAWERQLRGSLGVKSANLETDQVEVEPAVPGRDLHLTLDVALQARIQALLDPRVGLTRVQQYHYGWKGTDPVPTTLPLGTPLDASVVVLDIQTGELLALCSNPSFTDGIGMSTGERATRAPFVNRVVESSYPPGSLIKPLLYGAAVTDGKVGIDEEIECTGHYYPEHTDRFRCWIYRDYYGFATHGPLDIGDALMRSCNIYFYDLADRLGNEGMVRWLKQYGLDDPLRVGLLHERAGRWRGETGGNVPARASSLPQLGIGQGELLWSPVQAANAYATFARGGLIRDARLITDESLLNDRRDGDLELDPRAVTAALEGMRRVVEERDGTGGAIRYESGYREPIFDIPGIQVWGKTGTAQSPPRRIDVDGDGAFGGAEDKTVRGLAHAWYAALVGLESEDRPRYVIVTLVEHGESGGRASGPIVAEVIRALQAEGYLEADEPGAGS